MDEVDLNLENYEELFGVTLNHSQELFENGGLDSLFGTKDISAAESNCPGAVAAEVLISLFLALGFVYNHLFIFRCLIICPFSSLILMHAYGMIVGNLSVLLFLTVSFSSWVIQEKHSFNF